MPRLSGCDAGTLPMPEQRHGHGDLRLLGERPDCRLALAEDDAVAGQDDRPLCRVDERNRIHAEGMTAAVDARHVRRGFIPVELADAELRVLGDVDQHRTRAAVLRDRKRLAHRRGDVARVRHEVVVLRDRQRDAGDVGLLERVRADEAAAHLSGDADDRRRVHHRGGDAGHHVRGTGTGCRDGDTRPCRWHGHSRRPCAWRPARA